MQSANHTIATINPESATAFNARVKNSTARVILSSNSANTIYYGYGTFENGFPVAPSPALTTDNGQFLASGNTTYVKIDSYKSLWVLGTVGDILRIQFE